MKKIKTNYLLIIAILIIELLFSFTLFPINHCSDIYNLFVEGYKDYAINWFVPSGRTVSAIVLNIFDFFKINIDTYIFIMKLFALLFANIAIFTFTKLTFKKLKPDTSLFSKIVCFIAILLIFFNKATYEFFYYAESAVMWLGVLLTILAIKIFLKDNSFKTYLKTLLLIFVALNCYQAVILIFIPIVLFFKILEEKSFKSFIITLLKTSLIILTNLLLGYILIKFLSNYYNSYGYNKVQFSIDFEKIWEILQIIIKQNIIQVKPNLFLLIFNLASILFILIVPKKHYINGKLISIFTLIAIMIISLLQVLAITSLTGFYMCYRAEYVYLILPGIVLLFLNLYTDILNTKLIKIIPFIIGISILIYNISLANYSTKVHRYTRQEDFKEGKIIAKLVNEYQSKNNIKLKKLIYCLDYGYEFTHPEVDNYDEGSFRIFASRWVLPNAINYFCNTNLTGELDQYSHGDYFDARDWDDFSEEQIVFVDDTMYLCIY